MERRARNKSTRRRGRSEGSIFRRMRNGKEYWYASISVGYDAEGRRQRREVTGRTKAEVQEKLARLQVESLDGTIAKPSMMKVGQFLDHWLDDVAKPSIRHSTFVRYRSVIGKHIKPKIGHIRLSKLQPGQVQGMYRRLEEEGASPRTRELSHAVLRRALGQAVKWSYTSRNVCTIVDRPRVVRREMTALEPEHVSTLLKEAKQDRFYAAYVVAVTTGLRMGEIFGLRWTDIDWASKTIYIQRAAQEVRGEVELSEPKSKRGIRRVPLADVTVSALRQRQKAALAEGQAANEYVFTDSDGGLIRRSNFHNRHWDPLRKRLVEKGVPYVRFHDLRHTAATMWLRENVHAKIVQEWLGHATVAFTLDVYGHALPSMHREAAERMNGALGRLLDSDPK